MRLLVHDNRFVMSIVKNELTCWNVLDLSTTKLFGVSKGRALFLKSMWNWMVYFSGAWSACVGRDVDTSMSLSTVATPSPQWLKIDGNLGLRVALCRRGPNHCRVGWRVVSATYRRMIVVMPAAICHASLLPFYVHRGCALLIVEWWHTVQSVCCYYPRGHTLSTPKEKINKK